MEVHRGSKTVADTDSTDGFPIPSKNFSFVSSSSESDSSSDEFEPHADKTSTTDHTRLASEQDVPNTSNLRRKQSVSGSPSLPPISGSRSTKASPPVQKVRQTDSYRIPASAFAGDKSGNPVEWSVASNESLFSIHGNLSFSRDQSFFLGKSGELVIPEEPTTPAADEKSPKLEGGSGTTEPANGTKEVSKTNAVDNSKENMSSLDGGPKNSTVSQNSDESRSSVQSFAFPILASEGGRSGSLKMTAPAEEQPQQQQQQQQQEEQEQPQSKSELQTPAAAAAAQASWFSCLLCCR